MDFYLSCLFLIKSFIDKKSERYLKALILGFSFFVYQSQKFFMTFHKSSGVMSGSVCQ